MASYNELLALIDAYINQNGVQAITGQVLNGVLRAMVDQLGRGYSIMGAADPTTDPGTPDGPESWFASVPGTYTNFDCIQIADGELALLSYTPSDGFAKNTLYDGFQEVTAQIDGNVGTPAVGVSYANGILSFDFHNMKGETGDPAGFGSVSATIDDNIGTPSVSVAASGPDTARNFAFNFRNLKGETGVTSVLATVDNTSGNPQCAVSLQGQQLTLAFTGLKGAQGDTGSSIDYPFTIVNNLTTNDATQALSAAMGVQLESEVSQLEAKVTDLTTTDSLDKEESATFSSSDETEEYAKIDSNGIRAKKLAYKSGNDYVDIEEKFEDFSGISNGYGDSEKESIIITDDRGNFEFTNIGFSAGDSGDDDVIFGSESNPTEEYVRITKKGVLAKGFFDLNGNTIENRKKTPIIYDFGFNDLSDFTLSSGWSISGGVLVNSLYGINNRLLLGKSFTLDPRLFICDFQPSLNTELFFGTQRDFQYYGDGNMLISVDFSSKQVKYYGKFSESNIPVSPALTANFTADTYTDRTFRIIIQHKNRGVSLCLYDLLNGEKLCELVCVDGNELPSYVCYDNYFIYSGATQVEVKRILISTENYSGECKAIIYGDSITYGQGNAISQTYAYKLAEYLGNSFVSGLSGGTIVQVLSRLDTENKSQLPRYTVVCIGTNGGNTADRLRSVIEKCLAIDSIPIMCTTPQLGNTIGVSGTNEQIISVCAEYGLIPVRFDIATSINNDPNNGRNTDLFVDTVHPNPAGQLAMFNRIFTDHPELIRIINN